jgi:biotin synthase
MSYLSSRYWRTSTLEEVSIRAKSFGKAGMHKIYMPSGCMGPEIPDYFFEYLIAVKESSGLETFGFFGAVNKATLSSLKSVGADGYWCGIEMPNEEIFRRNRPGDDFKARLDTLRDARELGLITWSGFITGMGESEDDIIYGLELMKEFSVDAVLITPFRPWPFTAMEAENPANMYEWAKVLAITRVFLGNIDIFVSPEFASWGLRAGANAFFPVFPKDGRNVPIEKDSVISDILEMRKNVNNMKDG